MIRNEPAAVALRAVLSALLLAACSPGSVGPPVETDLANVSEDSARRIAGLVELAGAEPDDAQRRAALGMAYDLNGLVDAARTSYEQAVALQPGEPRWSYYLAHLEARGGHLEQALAHLDEVLDLHEGYLPAHYYRERWLFDLGRRDAARAAPAEEAPPDPWLDARSASHPADADALREAEALLALSKVYHRQGDLPQALAHAERAIALQPTLGSAHALRGRYLMSAGRNEEALQALDVGLSHDPRDPAACLAAGMLEARRGDWARAGQRFEQALQLDPSLALAHIGLGGAQAEMGQLEAARRSLDRAAALQPESPRLAAARQRLAALCGAAP